MKINKSNSILLFLAIILLAACSIETEPINYGKENCAFCKMTIMDKQFGTELVTQKGKIFKFDDLSCMSKYMKTAELHEGDCKFVVINNFDKPSEFIDFNKAFFVQSDNLQSPMLGNIAAFDSETSIQEYSATDSTAKSITWTEIKALFE